MPQICWNFQGLFKHLATPWKHIPLHLGVGTAKCLRILAECCAGPGDLNIKILVSITSGFLDFAAELVAMSHHVGLYIVQQSSLDVRHGQSSLAYLHSYASRSLCLPYSRTVNVAA